MDPTCIFPSRFERLTDDMRILVGMFDVLERDLVVGLYRSSDLTRTLVFASLSSALRDRFEQQGLLDKGSGLTRFGMSVARWFAFVDGSGPDPVLVGQADRREAELGL